MARCAGMQEKPALFQALLYKLRGSPCNPICHIYSRPPPGPPPSSNKPAGFESNTSIRRERERERGPEIYIGQVVPHPACDVAWLQIFFGANGFRASASSGSSQLSGLSAAPALREAFKCAPAAMHSLNDLFIC